MVLTLKIGSSNLQSRATESFMSDTPFNMKRSLSISKTHSVFIKFKETTMEVLQSKNRDKQDHLISLNSFAIEFVPILSLKVFGVAINSTLSLP